MDILDALSPYMQYWTLLVVTGALMLIGKVSAAIFHKGRTNWMWWLHKTLSVQPLVWGALSGALFHLRPSLAPSVLAGIGCGAASVAAYQIAKGLLKQRGIDLDLPGLDGQNDDS